MKQLRQYSKDYKVEGCKLVLEDDLSTTHVDEKLGIHPGMLSRWVREYQTLGDDAFVGTGHQRSRDAELKKMQKEIERLKAENEIKK